MIIFDFLKNKYTNTNNMTKQHTRLSEGVVFYVPFHNHSHHKALKKTHSDLFVEFLLNFLPLSSWFIMVHAI